MERTKHKGPLRKSLACLIIPALLAVNVLHTSPAYALGGVDLQSSLVSNFINEYKVDIAPGVLESQYSYEDLEGKRTQAFVVNVDMNNPDVSIEAATPYGGDTIGMQTVMDQADTVSYDGHRVVAAVNGDYYNMANGAPFGAVYKDGKQVIPDVITPWRFFAITKEGKAIICDTDYLTQNSSDIKEAIGGQAILVKDGKLYEDSPFNKSRNPRTGVGIKANGDVFFVTVDGRQAPYSSGITSLEFAQLMIDLGAQTALDFDGGGSTTYVSRKPGADNLQLVNKPSTGTERKVANSWLIVSTAQSDHAFSSAFIEPYDESFTPGSTVQFSFKGRDKSLASAPAPSNGLKWGLSDYSFGSIDKNGKFVSNGKTGQFQVILKYLGQVVGNTWVEICNPDQLQFASSAMTVISNSVKPLKLTAAFNKRPLNLNSDDIQWTIPDGLGTIDENGTLHVSNNPVSGRITARYKASGMETSIDIIVGKAPDVLFKFEDASQNWKPSVVGLGETASTGIASSINSPVRFDNGALQIDFDFTGAVTGATLGVYVGPGKNIPIPWGTTSIGMWVYGTPEAKGYWLRMALIDGNNSIQYLNFTPADPGINWTGWKYVEAKLPSNLTGPVYLHPDQAIRLMSANSGVSGPMTKGKIYVDNIRVLYGERTDDVYAPVIESVSVDGSTYNTRYVDIEAKIHDYDGDSYMTGIDWNSARIIVDGRDYSGEKGHFAYDEDGAIVLTGLRWSDGVHEVTITIQDNSQNQSSRTVNFTVNTD